ncbi:ABC transporter ATP-binding protein [Dictyobacter sp. S3.2.2.5]|uniref:ABC transporter ATP-binding protein n=1 Tax=Dictyobacter halimunensis TaxID=3026934 RepID=A0ABQ6FM81_9CHLR|nr:ABC transporter ATP-binding protein [Dictyobacter sp. S3.2.2.5]
MAIIEAHHLSKTFQQHRRFPGFWGAIRTLFTHEYITRQAVRDISFAVERGEAVGYVGPNGAGKSTTIKMLTGVLVPTSGTVLVNGRMPHKARQENARRIGVIFGQRSQLWWELPVIDSFDLHRHMYRIRHDQYAKNLAFFEELLCLKEFLHSPVRQLSLGQRMRAEIALALLHDPDILFLDEPTIGLDITAKDRIREFLQAVNREREVTIILTSHDLKDIEEICSRIVIINQGDLAYDGAVSDLKTRLGNQRTLTIEFSHDPGPITISGVTLLQDDGSRKQFQFDKAVLSTYEVLSALAEKYPVVDISLEDTDIEDIIRTLYNSMGEQALEREQLDTWTRGKAVTK